MRGGHCHKYYGCTLYFASTKSHVCFMYKGRDHVSQTRAALSKCDECVLRWEMGAHPCMSMSCMLVESIVSMGRVCCLRSIVSMAYAACALESPRARGRAVRPVRVCSEDVWLGALVPGAERGAVERWPWRRGLRLPHRTRVLR